MYRVIARSFSLPFVFFFLPPFFETRYVSRVTRLLDFIG